MEVAEHPEFAELSTRVGPLAQRFSQAGYRFYLVGGLVRDLVLGRKLSSDVDVTTDALPEEIIKLLRGWADAVWDQGARFGTIGASTDGIVYEITTHRSESYSSDSRKPVVDFSSAIDDDLARRDFTVNAMAVEVPGDVLVDPHGGRDDLVAGVLRTPLDPMVSFSDDPLRMLRAARFSSGYELQPVEGLESAIVSLRDRIGIVSRERIRDEFDKLFSAARPAAGLTLLARTGLLGLAIPGAGDLPAARFELLDRLEASPSIRLAALLESATTGRSELTALLQQLRFSSKFSREVVSLVGALRQSRAAVAVGADGEPVMVAARRLLHAYGDFTELALAVLDADQVGNVAALLEAVRAVRTIEGVDELAGPLTGHDVVAAIGAGSGPVIGEALAMLTEARLTRGPMTSGEAKHLLERWWETRPTEV